MSVSFWITAGLLSLWAAFAFFRLHIKRSIRNNRARILRDLAYNGHEEPTFLGFFHPYCDAGGGGERVLWTAVRYVQHEFNDVICAIYTGDIDVSREQILLRVKTSFNIDLDARRVAIVYLKKRYLVEDGRYRDFAYPSR
ncbi:hypothetical protein DM01DRAFT_1138171 [Hesseltinella vesiculosa]|uniref:ALG11 mannosyltransferase N-terminal domain-containing protein n=1 Tax=Hesseltinella vesiculosa TaxID=101127 RepID=A0A1X2G8N9_9FUNG|nr:hypothetical protein DM01DRAFT_1138171 [Hesseltinella vesiculosa]